MGGQASRIAHTAAQTATNAASSLASRLPSNSSPSWLSPTHTDVLELLDLLQNGLRLPPELAVQIIDAAEYYPSFVSSWEGNVTVSAGRGGHRQQADLLQTPPIPAFPGASSYAVRRIRVTTVSRDQGFSSFRQYHGTREGSSSWFELELRRPRVPETPPGEPPNPTHLPQQRSSASSTSSSSHDSSPPRPDRGSTYETVSTIRLHSNIHGHSVFMTYSLTLSDLPCSPDRAAAAFVRQVKEGDTMVVVACAMYPLWENVVRACAVEVEMMVV